MSSLLLLWFTSGMDLAFLLNETRQSCLSARRYLGAPYSNILPGHTTLSKPEAAVQQMFTAFQKQVADTGRITAG